MSWLEALSEFSQGYSEGQGAAVSFVRGAIMGAAARAGASGNAVLSALRSAGMGIRTQTFYEVWRGIQAQVGAGPGLYAVPPEAQVDRAMLPVPPEGWTGQFTHQVELTYRVRTEEGYEVRRTWRNVVARDILAPAEAVQAALDIVATPTETGTPDIVGAENVLSSRLSGLWYRTAPGAGSMAAVAGR